MKSLAYLLDKIQNHKVNRFYAKNYLIPLEIIYAFTLLDDNRITEHKITLTVTVTV